MCGVPGRRSCREDGGSPRTKPGGRDILNGAKARGALAGLTSVYPGNHRTEPIAEATAHPGRQAVQVNPQAVHLASL